MNEQLLSASDSRELTLAILHQGKPEIPRGSVAALARRASLSRSFLTEYLQRKKNLTARSMSKLMIGLKLQGDLKLLFELLTALEAPGVRENLGIRTESELKLKLSQFRKKLWHKFEAKAFREKQLKAPLSLEIFLVFAALGSLENGAEFSQILRRTQLEPQIVAEILNQMIEIRWVETKENRFVARTTSLDFQDLGRDDGFLRAFAQSCSGLAKNALQIAAEAENLTFFCVVPVHSQRVKELKERLRSAVLNVLDEFQDDEGACLKKITLGLH